MVRESSENDGRITIIEGKVINKTSWTQSFGAIVWDEVEWSSLYVEIDKF
jgi:hypothetical protein